MVKPRGDKVKPRGDKVKPRGDIIIIPAKGLLFGEYSLLYHGKSIACLLPDINFEIQINIEKSVQSNIIVESDFKDNFFCKAIFPWRRFLKNHTIFIKIIKSFSPSLGFGSSSALITAISYALFIFVKGKKPKISDEFLWKKIRASLKNTQGIASGYDVGVQLAYLIKSKNLFWSYQNRKGNIVPSIHPLSLNKKLIPQLGCFVSTHVYSETSRVLKNFHKLNKKTKMIFVGEHKKIAETFLHSKTLSTLKNCMKSSIDLSEKQGICANESLMSLLTQHNIPFKTMGSGCGDCLWVLETKENLLNLGILAPEDIVFSFADFVN